MDAPAASAITELLKWGPAGAVAALAIIAWWRERAKVDDLNEKRLADHKEHSKLYYELARHMDQTLETALEAMNRERFR